MSFPQSLLYSFFNDSCFSKIVRGAGRVRYERQGLGSDRENSSSLWRRKKDTGRTTSVRVKRWRREHIEIISNLAHYREAR